MAKHLISKTSYIKGLQCKKAVYLYKHYPKHKDALSSERLKRFSTGHEIGFMARKIFPGGIDISAQIPATYDEYLKSTQEQIKLGKEVIYEATFKYNEVLVMLDILVKTETGWKAIEVKSSIAISETYKEDASLQYYVITGSGLPLEDFSLMYLNKPWNEIKKDEEASSIFITESQNERCKLDLTKVHSEIEDIRRTLAGPGIPSIKTGAQCNTPYPCDFIGFCTRQESEIAEGLFENL
jgi:hypothetical protein